MPQEPATARLKRRETEMLAKESRWLQKAMFAIGKVNEARTKLAETRGTELEPLTLTVGEQTVPLPEVRAAFASRVEQLRNLVKRQRYRFR